MTWLIAEDETDIRNLIATMCNVWGYATLIFENGQKVWEWLDEVEAEKHKDKMPDFVLMDIRMPGKKGDEIAYRMRSLAAFNNIPIALMTAYSLTEAEKQAMINPGGVDQVIAKPLPDFTELHTVLHEAISSRKAVGQ